MSRRALIALVGRPNVGKSALFNAIVGKRISIVDEAEGVTRDRLYATSELFGKQFDVIDTGGIAAKGTNLFSEEVTRQALIAIEEADSIIQVVDATAGITPLDLEVAKVLRRTKKPVCLAVNKIDNEERRGAVHLFASLGIPNMIAVSAIQRYQMAELIETALNPLPSELFDANEIQSPPKVAIVGRPNVGKSLFINTLLGEDRCIVSPIAGTTRDSIDTPIELDGKQYILIDTAGIRRKHKEKEVVEKFASMRTQTAIERADICVLLLDCQQGLTTEDKKILSQIEEAGKGCVIALNKWDLVKGFRMEHALQGIDLENTFVKHCPKICTSAMTGRNLKEVFEHVDEVLKVSSLRITTHQLNKATIKWLQTYHPPVIGGRRLRIYYLAQIGINPPRFVLFVNAPKLLEESYKRYLVNKLRETFHFNGVPLVFHVRGKETKAEQPTKKKKEPSLSSEADQQDKALLDRDLKSLRAHSDALAHHEKDSIEDENEEITFLDLDE